MAIASNYGMGTYNIRSPSVNIRLPQTAGGVSTPLAFFPSTRTADATENLDNSLTALIDSASGGSNGIEAAPATTETSAFNYDGIIGAGLGSLPSRAVGVAVNTLTTMEGVPAPMASMLGGLAKGVTGKGLSTEDMANMAFDAIAVSLGLPGFALGIAHALGFNPAQGIAETLGLTGVAPGYEGGFFGTPGIGSGVSGGSIAAPDVDTTPAGFTESDLGFGLTGSFSGLQSAMSNTFSSDAMGLSEVGDSFSGGYEGMATESSYGDMSSTTDSDSESY